MHFGRKCVTNTRSHWSKESEIRGEGYQSNRPHAICSETSFQKCFYFFNFSLKVIAIGNNKWCNINKKCNKFIYAFRNAVCCQTIKWSWNKKKLICHQSNEADHLRMHQWAASHLNSFNFTIRKRGDRRACPVRQVKHTAEAIRPWNYHEIGSEEDLHDCDKHVTFSIVKFSNDPTKDSETTFWVLYRNSFWITKY